MSLQENKAASYSGPVGAADPTGARGVFAEPLTAATNVSRALPAGIPGNFVDLQALTADVRVNFSPAAVTLTYAAASPLSGTPAATRGFTIPAGTCKSVFVPKDCLFINMISNATAELELYCSEYTQKLLSQG